MLFREGKISGATEAPADLRMPCCEAAAVVLRVQEQSGQRGSAGGGAGAANAAPRRTWKWRARLSIAAIGGAGLL